jgi:glutamate racemase
MKQTRRLVFFALVLGLALVWAGDIVDTILGDRSSFYYLDTRAYPRNDPSLPVGVFDSGTGGLTVLKEILDRNRNEGFVFYGDQANMPYGTYPEEKNTPLLIEHIVKDIQFLLGRRYYLSAGAAGFASDKQPVKAIVIACNTATAWGMGDIRTFLERGQLPLKVIGVIDAGARGALTTFGKQEDGSVGVLATVGTVQADGYGKALRRLAGDMGYQGRMAIFQQGSVGIAGAIDGAPEYISAGAKAARAEYRGPKVAAGDAARTGLDTTGNRVLPDGAMLQLNSIENHIAYDTLMLVEQLRRAPGAKPLKTVILGCTHYPFYTAAFAKQFARLYDYQEDGKYPYRPFLARQITLVDPAVNTAQELHQYLAEAKLFNTRQAPPSEFYVSVPNRRHPGVQTDAQGFFPYAYKYSRRAGTGEEFVRAVPFSRASIPADTLDRLREKIPSVYGLIVRFSESSPKLRDLPAAERIAR